ncbi:MAG: NTP transferase domain-containing protein [Gemmatimonadales bacterium]|nr:NTP transferase domain-containing protein [Gemmatimonadota bacterium]MBP6442763.1 NTP transferase domain-containing protein [Gemmatimonadales bacterium]MBP6570962.1 NTP transferase domain-containing protein [Gemmatimonadales bacterium]MBP7621020.1 NTP transferase domain-containing protein [Gemmatimonadales bacterium]
MTAAAATAAVILARGLGSRMRRPAEGVALDPRQAAAAAAGLKGMIPDDAGRPFLDHVLSSLADGGITDVCLVVAPDHAAIRAHYTAHPPTRVRLAWAIQAEPRGTADAVLAAESWAAGRDVLVLNADNLYPVAAIAALVTLGGPGLIAFDPEALVREGNIEAARIASFAILTLREDGSVAAIIEKPDAVTLAAAGPTPWVSMNLFRLDHSLFAACHDVTPSPRGELELPTAVTLAIGRGTRLQAVTMRAGVLDLSRQDDIAAVAAALATARCAP